MKRLLLLGLLAHLGQATTQPNLGDFGQALNPAYKPGSNNYNELNKDIISRHKQFRVIADERFQWDSLDQINAKRELHDNTRPLKLGYRFTNYTVDRAHSILRDIESKRDIVKGQLPLGESFFWYYDPNRYRTVNDAINAWYEERRLYDYNRPGFSAKTGGFTQLVWKGSKEAACAKIDYETREHFKTLVVCNFYPAGNVNGEFPYNVLPPRRGGGGGSRPEYPSDDRPNRPGGGGGGSRPEYPSDDRPSRPGGGGGGGGRPRPPYDEEDRPNRPGGGGGGGGGYPTHPVVIVSPFPQKDIITNPYPILSSADQMRPTAVEQPGVSSGQQPQTVLVSQVDPMQALAPVVYSAESIPQIQQQPQPQQQPAPSGQVYEPIEAILIVPQYAPQPGSTSNQDAVIVPTQNN